MTSAFLATAALAAGAVAVPPAPKRPVTETYHGTPITDDYRWLEDWNSTEVQDWSEAQNDRARAILDALSGVPALRARLTGILAAETTSHRRLAARPGRTFALRHQPPRQQPFLVVMPSPEAPDEAKVLLDPNTLDEAGTTTIDWYVPSPDGKLVAVSLSKGGSESGDVHVYDAETGEEADAVVVRAHGGTAGGDLTWAADGKGFFYTRYPRSGERPPEDADFYQQVYYHALGTAIDLDRYELGKDQPRIAEFRLETDPLTGRVLATVQDGDGGKFAFFVRSPEGSWRQIARFEDGLVQAAFGPGGDLFAVSRKDAPRGKVLRLAAADPDLAKAAVVVAEGNDAIVTNHYGPPGDKTVLPCASRLYVTYQVGGPTAIRCFALDGTPLPAPVQPEIGAVDALVRYAGDDVLFSAGSYVEPTEQYLYRAATGETEKLPLTAPPVVEFKDVTVVREFATSEDGTKVPVNILVPDGATLDGSNPCLVTGYGGYGISLSPRVHPAWRVLFDHGFVVAVANLRGGGEFGDDWHRAGSLTNKQNVFDDFAAVLRHLTERGYTSPARLAIEGGSNGGLLMGAMLTQHPELMACVISHVGVYDMLRSELSPNGAFNIPEFGTVADETQFRALYAYSPYHHVTVGTDYPTTLFLTGANDPRVDPLHSRKMTARLQAAAPGGTVLLRTTASAGHGLDTSLAERVEEAVDVTAFLFAQLEVTVH